MKSTILLLLTVAFVATNSLAQEKSNDYYLKLAQQGDAVAQNEIGVRVAEGDGTKSNKAAVRWFRKSAEQGNALGACNLGLHYARGAGVSKNLVTAFKWFYIANSLDNLKCAPGDYFEMFRPSKAQDRRAWAAAVAWLRARPELKNDFGRRPWLEGAPQSNNSLNRTRLQLGFYPQSSLRAGYARR